MILVFDTSTTHLSIGLSRADGELVGTFTAEATPNERGIHDARLARETDNLLRQAGAAAQDISRIGLIIGPGSFTGLRIGLSFAKGLAFASDAGMVGLTQHEVLKASFHGDAEYIVTPGYRATQVYFSKTKAPRDIQLLSLEEFQSLLPRPTIVHTLLHSILGLSSPSMSIEITPQAMVQLTAESTVLLRGEAIDALEPLYLTEFKPGG